MAVLKLITVNPMKTRKYYECKMTISKDKKLSIRFSTDIKKGVLTIVMQNIYNDRLGDPMKVLREDLLALLEFRRIRAISAYGNNDAIKMMVVSNELLITSFRRGYPCAIRIPEKDMARFYVVIEETLKRINGPF